MESIGSCPVADTYSLPLRGLSMLTVVSEEDLAICLR